MTKRHRPITSALIFTLAWILASACASHGNTDHSVPDAEPQAATETVAEAPVEATPASLEAATISLIQRHAPAVYDIRDARGLNPSQQFEARFASDGVTVMRDGSETSFSLRAIKRGDASVDAVAALPSFDGNEASYERADVDVREWYLNGPLGIEQGFDIASRPFAEHTGELVIEVEVDTLATIKASGDKVLLQQDGKTLVYGHLFVSDATSRQLPATLSVRNGLIEIKVDDAAAVYPIQIDPLVYEQKDKVKASDEVANGQFGISVAVDGDLAVIGSPGAGGDVGAAYVLLRAGDQWNEEAKLSPMDAPAGALFGNAVAIDGDYVAVGAKGDDFSKGAVYVYKRDAMMMWSEQTKLKANDAQGADELGYSVAIDGNTIAAGAPGDDDKGSKAGAAYVFVRDMMDAWSEQAKLTGNGGKTLDGAGRSVAIVGDMVAVGAPYADKGMMGGVDCGVVMTFRRDMMNVWTESQTVEASMPVSGEQFGWAVAAEGTTLVVGAPKAAANSTSTAGAAYVFVEDMMGVYAEEARLVATDPSTADHLGTSVAIDGNRLIAGTPQDDGKATNSGSAYVFERSGTMWAEQAKITSKTETQEDQFGHAVALVGAWAVIGAPGYDGIGGSSGIVYALKSSLANGSPCTMAAECSSGFCVDDVCCDTACSGGTSDCSACSKAAGAAEDGTCGNTTGNTCDDGDACTQTDTCQDGMCSGADPVQCMNADECNDAGSCDSSTGMCGTVPKEDGTMCTGGSCQGGMCVPEGSSSTGGSTGSGSSGTSGGDSSSGGGDGDDGDGGGCAVVASPGNASGRPLAAGMLLLGLGLMLRRRRRD